MNDFLQKKSCKWILYFLLLTLLILDKINTLTNFGFVYSDMDQLVMWYGAMDYSNGVFHEPFFYGQPYNYMVESFLSVPLIWTGIPIYKALPIISTFLSIFPFVMLSLFFMRYKHFFLALTALSVPIVMPIEYDFLTTLPRGFLQAHLFIPLLYFPLFNPTNKINITLLFLGSALCFIANQSSIIIVFPILIYVWLFNIKSLQFYLKSLLTVPIFGVDIWAKYFYKIYPEKVRHDIVGLEIDPQTFWETIPQSNLFEYLAPFGIKSNIFYFLLLSTAVLLILLRKKKLELTLWIASIIVILVTFSIPKVQTPYPAEGANVFFSVSRLYLTLPILGLIIINSSLDRIKLQKSSIAILMITASVFSIYKYNQIETVATRITSKTSFPIDKNSDILQRASRLKQLVKEYNVDLMIHDAGGSKWWSNWHDSYSYNPINFNNSKIINSVYLENDRRTWLYEDSKECNSVLLFGIELSDSILTQFNYERIDHNCIWIKNNSHYTDSLMKQLDLFFGLH